MEATTEERLQGIIRRLNREEFERFLIVKQQLIDIATGSVSPEPFEHLGEVLKEIEDNLKVSLGIER